MHLPGCLSSLHPLLRQETSCCHKVLNSHSQPSSSQVLQSGFVSPSSVLPLPQPFEQTPDRTCHCHYHPLFTSCPSTRQQTHLEQTFSVSIIRYERAVLWGGEITLINPHIFIYKLLWKQITIVKGFLPSCFEKSLYVDRSKMKLNKNLVRSCYGFRAILEIVGLLSFLEFFSISDRCVGHRSLVLDDGIRYSPIIRIMWVILNCARLMKHNSVL